MQMNLRDISQKIVEANNIVIVTGAGISTASGIPVGSSSYKMHETLLILLFRTSALTKDYIRRKENNYSIFIAFALPV